MASPFILLKFNKVQNIVVDIITSKISEKLGAKIEIDRVDYGFFNQLQLEGFYLEDLQKDTLLYVDELNTTFNFRELFNNRIRISSVTLNRAFVNLKTDSAGISNLDFVLKQFKSTGDSSRLDLRLNRLKINDSRFYFTGYRAPVKPKVFNAGRIRIREFSTDIQIKQYNRDTLDARMKNFYAKEQSGLIISDLNFKINGSPRKLTVSNLNIEMPASSLKLPEIEIQLNELKDFTKLSEKMKFNFPLKNTEVALNDLKAFVPGFAGSKEKITLDADISGKVSNLKIRDLKVKYGRGFEFNADLDINGLPEVNESFIYADIQKIQIMKSDLQDFIARLSNKPFILPDIFNRLGTVTYTGNITGFLTDLVAYGNLNSEAGSLSSDFSVKLENNLNDISYSGSLKTENLSLRKLINDSTFGNVAINLKTTGTKKHKQPLKGTVDAELLSAEFNQYTYKNIGFIGKYDGSGFNGNIDIKDENLDAAFMGIIDFKNPKIPVFDFDLTVNNSNLYALRLIKEYPDSKLSFHGKTNISGSSFDNLNGFINFDHITFTNQGKVLNGNSVSFKSKTDPGYTHFSIRSDYLNGTFSGDFKYSSIGKTFRNILAGYLPALDQGNAAQSANNKVTIDLTLDNTNEISRVLNLPYELEGKTTLSGNIDESKDKIEFYSKIASVKTEKQIFDNLTLRLENKQNLLKLTGRAQMHDKVNGILNMFLSADAGKDALGAKFIWQNNEDVTNAGEIDTRTLFFKQGNSLKVHTKLNPTQIIISDSVWDLRSSDIYFNSDSLITVNNFMFESKRQYININGEISKNKHDSLTVSMNDLNLDYIMRLIRLKGISMGGIVTGKVRLFSLLKEPIYLADLSVKDFSLNNKIISDAKLKTHWDKVNNQLVINGDFINKNNELVAIGKGVLVPKTDSLNVNIEAKKVPATFLNRYFEGVASNFSGFGAGNIRLFGPTKHLRFDGDVMVTDGKVTIDMLKTTYRFNDRVRLTPKKIDLSYIRLYDEDRNQAVLNGSILHDGGFSKMKYDIRLTSDNILALNTKNTDEDFFYGKAYVGGLVRIFGDDDVANIVVNGTSKPKTKCYMSMGTASTVIETDFIKFLERRIATYVDEYQESRRQFVNEDDFNVKVDMQIEVTPEAEMEILVDPSAGDKITGRGRGNIRIKFDTFSDVELYGTVELEQGYYLFTLQTVIRKEFKINSGSTITWTGDPFGAKVNINGYYPLTASLADLIEREELQQITNRSTVPVHCLLYLTDDLMSPDIRFGIDLPSSDETLKSRVRNVINTEEMMNRQILYLLLVHKFFTPDYMRSTGTVFGWNEGISLATATASAQINNWIQSTLNTNVFSVGFDWQKADAVSDEVKAQILIQPNDRLVINGEVGYRNDNISENKLIGDFDIEYKLVESGKLRFTVYNHTIDRAQLREAKFTQGIGLIYREDFNNLGEMFRYYWELTKGIFVKKDKKNKQAISANP